MESRTAFRLMYLVGFTPWDNPEPPPELVALLDEIPEPGRALDLGCGSGRNSALLAGRGWEVTGVDFVPRAVKKARRRMAAEGLPVTILAGDVTRLEEAGVRGPFQLLLDVGCFHSLPAGRRLDYERGAAAVAAPGATFLLFAFTTPSGPRPGVPPAEVEATFAEGWELVEKKIDPPPGAGAWYRFHRLAD
jgi:cyclopropane fatty-acyl-phospholipid synthase-like methyltransferase